MLGIENYGNRSIAEVQDNTEKRNERFWGIFFIQITAGAAAIVLYALSFFFISPERYTISILQGTWLLSSLLNVNWYFFGTERFRLTVIRSIIVKLISVAAIAGFIRKPSDLPLYTAIMAFDSVLSNGLLWPFLLKDTGFRKPPWALIRTHLKPIFVLFIPILAISVFHIMDKTMLDLLSTEEEVGFYYSADKLINIPLMAVTAVSTVMLPRISNLYSKKDGNSLLPILSQSMELTMFLACAVGLGLAAIAKEFVPLFFGPGYDPCVNLVYWFVPVLLVKTMGDFVRMQYLIPTHHDKLYTYAICAGALTNLAFNLLLIPHHGAAGAVWATLIAEIVVTVTQIAFLHKELHFTKLIMDNISYLFFALIMLIFVRFIADKVSFFAVAKLLIMIFFGAACYIGLCCFYWKKKGASFFSQYLKRRSD